MSTGYPEAMVTASHPKREEATHALSPARSGSQRLRGQGLLRRRGGRRGEAAGLTKGAVYRALPHQAGAVSGVDHRARQAAAREASRGAPRGIRVPRRRSHGWAKAFARAVADRRRIGIDLEFLTYAARDPKLRREVREIEERGAKVNSEATERLWPARAAARPSARRISIVS